MTGHTRYRRRSTRNRGLSLVEMLLALMISSMLLTAALSALDVMFKGYKQTTESASTHVVSRIVMSRLQGMIRTGTEFGPIPADVLNENLNPLGSDYFEFVGRSDAAGNPLDLIRIEFRDAAGVAPLQTWSPPGAGPIIDPNNPPPTGPGELWFVLFDATQIPPALVQEHPLITGVRALQFSLEYAIGPRLALATVDMTIEPNDSRDLTVGSDIEAPTIRLVASGAPRTGVR